MGVNRAVKLHGIVQVDRNLTVNEKAPRVEIQRAGPPSFPKWDPVVRLLLLGHSGGGLGHSQCLAERRHGGLVVRRIAF